MTTSKKELKAQIAADTAAFLAAGGKIEVIPPTAKELQGEFVPATDKLDYSTHR